MSSQNAHAYVNSAFEAATMKNDTFASPPVLVFGGISDTFVHAANTEAFLNGKKINDPNTLGRKCLIFCCISNRLPLVIVK